MNEEEQSLSRAIYAANTAKWHAKSIKDILGEGRTKPDAMELQRAILLAAETRAQLKYVEFLCEKMSNQP